MAVHRGPSAKWLFTRDQLENTPSRRCGIEADKELSYRQQAANSIQEIGQRLNVCQLVINTAIVYMHRFYMIHSFTKFHRNIISQTALFLASKVEEQPRKLEHVVKIGYAWINPQEPPLDTKSNTFQQLAQELVALETILLQTLGFEITVDHPHTEVVRCSQLVRASKDLAQTSYYMATNSLHLTTFCLQYRPTVVACVCMHLACKWSKWEIPVSTDGKHWWEYMDRTVTSQLLYELTHEFLQILEKTPSKLKRIRNWRASQAAKKPKTEGPTVDSAFQGTSLESLPGATSSLFPSTSDSTDMPDLNTITAPFTSYQPLNNQSKACGYNQFSQPAQSDFTLVKPKHNAASGTSGELSVNTATVSRPHKVLTLEKYREKQAAELALQNGVKQEPSTDVHTPSALSSDHHKKRSLPQEASQPSDRKEKPSSKKPRLATSYAENGLVTSEELNMRIKVSSERHGGSEQGGALPGKDKHREHREHREHSGHRHSKHSHSHSLSANNRGTVDNSSFSVRTPGNHCMDGSSSGSSRKRPHSDAGSHNQNHHHHSSKSSRTSKGSLNSSHYSDSNQRMVEHRGHGGTNGMLTSNGQHTDYKNTFDMLDSLLSAQGMNL